MHGARSAPRSFWISLWYSDFGIHCSMGYFLEEGDPRPMSKNEPVRFVERLDKYVGLAAAIAAAIAAKNPAYFFAFVGVAVVLLAVFLLRVLTAKAVVQAGEPGDEGDSKPKRAFSPRQRFAAVVGLVALVLATGAIAVLRWPKPPPVIVDLEIADLDITHYSSRAQWDSAVDDVLSTHAHAADLPLDGVRTAYEARDPEMVNMVAVALEEDPPEIALVGLNLTLRSERTESATLVKEITVLVHSATLLVSCGEEGQLSTETPYNVSLCPDALAEDPPVPYDVPGVSFELAAGTEHEVLEILVSNDPSCTHFPGLALYELELELLYDDDRRLSSQRFVIAVPTSTYGIGIATTRLEEGASFELGDACQEWNLDRAVAMNALWREDILLSSRADELRKQIQRIDAERSTAAGQ